MTLLVGLVAAAGLAACGGGESRGSGGRAAGGATAVIAAPAGDDLAVFPERGARQPQERFGPTTPFGSPRVLLVRELAGDWLRVLLPRRPDGTEGWVRRADVRLTRTTYRVEVSVADRRLRAFDGSRVVVDGPVAVGAAETPTPKGTYFVTDVVAVPASQAWYGPFALGLSGYSPTLDTFEGGDAQIAIHGTDRPELLGQAVSHGCLRTGNDVVTRLAKVLPLGTPVVISP